MTEQPIAVFVDRAGNPPPKPVAGTLPSSEPGRLTAILAAIGLDVRRVAQPPGAVLARTTGVALTVVKAAMPPAGAKDQILHFLVADLNSAFQAAVSAGAAVAFAPQQTP